MKWGLKVILLMQLIDKSLLFLCPKRCSSYSEKLRSFRIKNVSHLMKKLKSLKGLCNVRVWELWKMEESKEEFSLPNEAVGTYVSLATLRWQEFRQPSRVPGKTGCHTLGFPVVLKGGIQVENHLTSRDAGVCPMLHAVYAHRGAIKWMCLFSSFLSIKY